MVYVGPAETPLCPARTPRNPAGATCDFPLFDLLEAEFEKVVFTKVVALATFYLIFKHSTAIFVKRYFIISNDQL